MIHQHFFRGDLVPGRQGEIEVYADDGAKDLTVSTLYALAVLKLTCAMMSQSGYPNRTCTFLLDPGHSPTSTSPAGQVGTSSHGDSNWGSFPFR